MEKTKVETLKLTLWMVPLLLYFAIALNYQVGTWVLPHYLSYDAKRIAEIVLLGLIFATLFLSRSNRLAWMEMIVNFPQLYRLCLLGIFVLGALSICHAPILKMAVLEYSFMLSLLFGLIFVGSLRVRYGEQFDRALLITILCGALLYVITFFYVYFKLILLGQTLNYFPGFMNERFLAQYLGYVLPLGVLPLLWPNFSKILKIILAIMLGMLWAIAIANAAKGLFLGLIVAAVVVALQFRGNAKRWFGWQAVIIAIGVVVYLLQFVVVVKLSGATTPVASVEARGHLWAIAWRMIVAHPFLGVGPMHYAHYPNPYGAHPHNSVLLIGAEWGLPALALTLIAVGWAVTAWMRRYNYKSVRNKEGALPIALSAAAITSICYSLVSGVIIMPLSQVMLVVVGGWMLGYYHQKRTESIRVLPLQELIFVLLAAFIVLGVVAGIFPDLFNLPTMEWQWAIQHVQNHHVQFIPRFWVQGWF